MPTQESVVTFASSRGTYSLILLPFCFHSQLISAADDGIMKVYDIEKGKLKLQKEIESGEIVSVCSNQVDYIILGGKNKQVEVF